MMHRKSLAATALAACAALAATASAESGNELDFETDDFLEEDDSSRNDSDSRYLPDGSRADDASATGAEPLALLYPRELVRRPVILPAGLVETSFEARAGVRELVGAGTRVRGTEEFRTSGTLSVTAGITDDVQVAIHYGAGSIGEGGAVPGRAASFEATYGIHRNIGAQVALPVHFDPFALGLTFGAPVKLVLGDRLALMGGHDLITFRLHRFQPHVDEPAENDHLAEASATNTVLPAGEFALRGAAMYQRSEALAIGGEMAVRSIDFDSGKPVVPLFGVLSYTPRDYIDIGARVGLFNLDGPGKNFGGAAFAAIRM